MTEVFDAQGDVAAAYDYSPYGQADSTGSLVQPVQWSGEMHDEEPALFITITAITTPETEGGSTVTPSLNREDGIRIRS